MADEMAPLADDAVPAEQLTEEEARRRKLRLTLLLTPIVILSFAGVFADWFAAALIDDHPLLQMMLNGRIRYLLLASNQIEAVPFFVVGFLRQVLTDPLFYLLGLWYGDAALRWAEKKTGETGLVPWLKRAFDRYGSVIIAVAPNGYVCLLAGAAGMKVRKFFILNVGGTIVRLALDSHVRQVHRAAARLGDGLHRSPPAEDHHHLDRAVLAPVDHQPIEGQEGRAAGHRVPGEGARGRDRSRD